MSDRNAGRNARGEFLPSEGSKRRSISTRLSQEEYDRFKDACAAAELAPTVLLRQLMLDWLEAQSLPAKSRIAA